MNPDDLAAVIAGPHHLAARLDTQWKNRAHTKIIGEAIKDALENRGSRTAIISPPQVGKSSLAAIWAPFWALMVDPSMRIVTTSYGQHLANRNGRAIRNLVRDHGEKFGRALAGDARSVSEWYTSKGGGVKSAGVGGGITGFAADCVPGDATLTSRLGPVSISAYIASGCPSDVLSYNHTTGRAEWRPVTAARTIEERPLVEVVTSNGRTIRCTPDHRIYTAERGYVAAHELKAGDSLWTLRKDLPDNQRSQEVLFRDLRQPAKAEAGMRAVWGTVPSREPAREVLLPDMLSGQGASSPELRTLRGDFHSSGGRRAQEGDPAVLLNAVLERLQNRDDSMSVMQEGVPGEQRTDVLFGRVPTGGDAGSPSLLNVRQRSHAQDVRLREAGPPGRSGVLLACVPSKESDGGIPQARRNDLHPAVPDMLEASREDRPILLLEGMSSVEEGEADQVHSDPVPAVQYHVPSVLQSPDVLLAGMRGSSALATDDGERESALQDGEVLHRSISEDATFGEGARRNEVRSVRKDGDLHEGVPQRLGCLSEEHFSRASHQRESEGQPTGKLDPSVQDMSCRAPQVERDTVALVRPVRGNGERVYDIQVEGNRNFFADGVLVHNCLIVDDVYKNRADAESELTRETIWEWLSSSALTRLAPGAPVFMIGTLWTEQDPILRLIDKEGRVEDGGKWRIVHLPAIANHGLTGPDPLDREDGDPLTHPMIEDHDREALLKHWDEKKASVLPRDWLALYQGDPHPREGALVSWEIMERATVQPRDIPPFSRIVTAIDPAGGGADEVGIVTAGVDADGIVYIVDDYASGHHSVTEWPELVCSEAERYDVDRIIFEANFGDRLVYQAIRSAWETKERSRHVPPITEVRALRGKILRAEPMAQEMAQGRIKIKAGLTELMKQWTSYRPGVADSPGRLDASVYCAVELLQAPMPGRMTSRRMDAVQANKATRRRLPGR